MENSNLHNKFNEDEMVSFWDGIRFWFLVRKVYRQKKTVLWEANLDKLYYETQYPEILNYNDADDRRSLMEENKKPEGDRNKHRIDYLEERISKAKAVKMAYRKNEEFIADIKHYISMLKLWMNQKNQN